MLRRRAARIIAGMKAALLLCVVALLALIVALAMQGDEPPASMLSQDIEGPAFEVRILKPRASRPLGGILPDGIFGLPPSELRFDHTSVGADVGEVGADRVELGAEGWKLVIVTDADGQVAPGTHVVFPLELGGRELSLRCVPADQATGTLRTTSREGRDELDGDFVIEFVTCEHADSGKAIAWPPGPLLVHGSFAGLPRGSR